MYFIFLHEILKSESYMDKSIIWINFPLLGARIPFSHGFFSSHNIFLQMFNPHFVRLIFFCNVVVSIQQTRTLKNKREKVVATKI